MSATNVPAVTTAQVIDEANPNRLADAIRKAQLGRVFSPLKRTFTGLTSSASHSLVAIDGVGETVGPSNTKRLPALCVGTLRVTAGTLAAGPAIVTDVGGTPTAIGALANHVATISDDGKTITFQAAVTAFVISYIPRAEADYDSKFVRS